MKNIVPHDENLSATVSAATTYEIFNFQVPQNAVMFVKNFGNYLDPYDAWGSITWIMKKNGSPIYPYHDIKDQLGWGAMLRDLARLEIKGGDLFTIDVVNNYVDVVDIGIAIKYEVHEV